MTYDQSTNNAFINITKTREKRRDIFLNIFLNKNLESPRTERNGLISQMEPVLLVLLVTWVTVLADDRISDRYEVYWNSSNPRFVRGEHNVDVSINDYLDIYCPHYAQGVSTERMERYVLFMVNYDGYSSCDPRRTGFKRWECNRPQSPNGPLKFSEKFQLFTPFSLGFEFRPGHEYYYISSPHLNQAGSPCLKLRVYVRPTNDSIYESPEPFLTDDTTGGGATIQSHISMMSTLLSFLLITSS